MMPWTYSVIVFLIMGFLWQDIVEPFHLGHYFPNPAITIYSEPNFQGEFMELNELPLMNSCNPYTTWYFNDRAMSIKLGPGICVRLYENRCIPPSGRGRYLDATPESPWLSDLSTVNFGHTLSSVGHIQCPTYTGPPPPPPAPLPPPPSVIYVVDPPTEVYQ